MEATHDMMHADKKGPLLAASLQHDDTRSSGTSSEACGSSDDSTATLTSQKLSFGIDQILDSTTSFRSPGVRPSHIESSRDADFRQCAKLLRDSGSHGESEKESAVRQYNSFNDWVGKFHTLSASRRPLSSMTFSRTSDACQRSLTTISSTGPCGGLRGQEDMMSGILPLFGPGVPLTSNASCTLRGAETAWAERCPLPWQPTQRDKLGVLRRVGHPYQNRAPPKRKMPRTAFTRQQIVELEKRFHRQKYLASAERSTLAKQLKMTDAQVKTWFQNRRTKWRRQKAEERDMERHAAQQFFLSLRVDENQPLSTPVCLPLPPPTSTK